MQLVLDANIFVGEALRVAGRQLLNQAELLLFATEEVKSESEYEIRRRASLMVRRNYLTTDAGETLLAEALDTFRTTITVRDSTVYAERLDEARRRISRDPSDAPTVALALALDCGIWTADADFFGCGIAVWASDVLRQHLAGRQINQ